MTAPTIIEAANDPAIWKRIFEDPDPATWRNWFVLVKALFGLPLDDTELPIFQECTGRTQAPTKRARAGWLIVGRRGGKSRILALIAAYLATFIDWSPYLSAGEYGVITVIAQDRTNCRWIMGYLRAFLVETELLAARVVKDSDEEILLSNGVLIQVVTCSYKAVRGRTIIAALCDEAAFWKAEDGSNPASEVIKALKPAMATVADQALLLVASSPYARRGPIFKAWTDFWGKDSRSLVWKAPTWVMNLDPKMAREGEFITSEYAEDPVWAEGEYGAQWRTDLESYLSKEILDPAIIRGCPELPPKVDSAPYIGFFDMAGGSGGDSATLAIAHLDRGRNRDTQRVVLDLVREMKPPFSPENAIATFARVCKDYGVRKLQSDRWGGDFPKEAFSKYLITCSPSEMTKSEYYLAFLPLITSQRVDLIDNPTLIKQLLQLERRTARGGKDSVDHPPGPNFHDDVANSASAACVIAMEKHPMIISAAALAASRSAPNPYASMTFGQKPKCFFNQTGEN